MKRIGAAVMAMLVILFWSSAYGARGYGSKLCQANGFECYKVKRGDSWQKLFPNDYERDIVKRVNRINIRLRSGMVIAVPNGLGRSHYMDFSPFSSNIGPQESKVLVVDPSRLAYGAYDRSGRLVHWGPMSGGQHWCGDVGRGCKTPSGQFKVSRKGSRYCASSKYPLGRGGAPMPHCMFFKGGYAIHGSPIVPGYNASHGCIRVFNEDAEWLNREFIDLPKSGGTKVIIRSYGRQTKI